MGTQTTDKKLQKLVIAAMFAAVITVATIVIQIPSPMNGYVNMGDLFVLLSAWMLGPVYGTAAAAIGSALADIITSYAYYAPGTFVIKGLMALAAYALLMVLVGESPPACARSSDTPCLPLPLRQLWSADTSFTHLSSSVAASLPQARFPATSFRARSESWHPCSLSA